LAKAASPAGGVLGILRQYSGRWAFRSPERQPVSCNVPSDG
jgi:hypothetical protein